MLCIDGFPWALPKAEDECCAFGAKHMPALRPVRNDTSVNAVSTALFHSRTGKPLKRLRAFRTECTGLKAGVNETGESAHLAGVV